MARVELGRITRPHGLRGEVRVHLHWPDSETLERADRVALRRGDEDLGERRVVSARRADRAVLLLLDGVRDRDGADELRGVTVSVERSELPPLEAGEYYLCDLIGARVFGPDGLVGEVVDVRVHPSVDTLVVRTPDGSTLEQPLAEPWIGRVDAAAKRVELVSTEGLI